MKDRENEYSFWFFFIIAEATNTNLQYSPILMPRHLLYYMNVRTNALYNQMVTPTRVNFLRRLLLGVRGEVNKMASFLSQLSALLCTKQSFIDDVDKKEEEAMKKQ
jgi:hypothetical protein